MWGRKVSETADMHCAFYIVFRPHKYAVSLAVKFAERKWVAGVVTAFFPQRRLEAREQAQHMTVHRALGRAALQRRRYSSRIRARKACAAIASNRMMELYGGYLLQG